MKPLLHVKGPPDAGPGERQEMLSRARAFFEQHGIADQDLIRIDVPGRGAGEGSGDGHGIRPELEPLVPALQSASLFGGRQGVSLVDAQHLHSVEADLVGELLSAIEPDAAVVAVLTAGSLAAPVARAVRARGDAITVKKMRERDAIAWIGTEARRRGLDPDKDAPAALVQRFGSDVAALGQALDQVAASGERITRRAVLGRFRNRPDEPMWHYLDAVAAGDTAAALRRLADFLAHGHPLVLLGFLENDLRRRAVAAAAPDRETLAERLGVPAEDFRVTKAWRDRRTVSDTELQRALRALHRADRVLKTEPEDTHRVTLERLTVALTRWYGR